MSNSISRIVILGGGSAGFIAALALRRKLPHIDVVVVHSPDVPIIGVGESTTRSMSLFLHTICGLDRAQFFREAKPSWKLGLRLEWGDPRDTHFNYPFDGGIDTEIKGLPKLASYYCGQDMRDHSLFAALMDRNRSPAIWQNDRLHVDDRVAYHIRNEPFVAYLSRRAQEAGAQLLEGTVEHVERRGEAEIASLSLADGRQIEGDFFVDCSGFRSLLLGETLGGRYVSYADALYCDTAVIGSWNRTDAVRPYTTVETMDHGWCWRIDFADVVTRGYVFSSDFCTADQAMQEMKAKNPELGDDLRVLAFPRGRYEDYWIGNVAAIGNSSGFVEPLEATALHLIIEQSRFLAQGLSDSQGRPTPAVVKLENYRFRELWDDVRDFLAVHYRFNRRLDTPFWRHCRADTPLGAAEELVEYYRQAGPSGLTNALIRPGSIFGYRGYMTMLMGQRVETRSCYEPSLGEQRTWAQFLSAIRSSAELALPMDEALPLATDPNCRWHS